MKGRDLASWVVPVLILAIAGGLGSSIAAAGDKPEGGASPEEVFTRLTAALKANDYAEMVACTAPGDRPMQAMSLVVGAGMMAAFSDDAEALSKDYEAILTKHGINLDDDEEAPPATTDEEVAANVRKAFKGVDLVALISDLMTFMDEKIPDAKKTRATPGGELSDLVIDGDTATATIDGETHGFVRVDGRWYVRAED